MSRRSRFIVSSLVAASVLGSSSAQAGGLCNWLFGRNETAYAAGYPYVAGYPYAAGYPYVPGQPYAAGYAPLHGNAIPVVNNPSTLIGAPAAPYAAGYAPYGAAYPYAAAYPNAVGYPYTANYAAPATAVQSPAYGQVPVGATTTVGTYDNPSVYTGQPVYTGSNYLNPGTSPSTIATALRPSLATNPFTSLAAPQTVPLSATLRGNETAPGSYYGTGNVYPNSGMGTSYQAGYAPQATYLPTTSYGAAYPNTTGMIGGTTTTMPATQVAPLFQPQPAAPGGLARFFGSLFGTNYSSSYYRAPITYYRPVNTLDPITGSTVVVQQPCTSYVDQLQRTPYSSLFAGTPAPALAPTTIAPSTINPGCASPSCSSPTYGLAPSYNAAPSYGQTLAPLQGNPSPAPSFAPSYPSSSIAPVTGYSDSVTSPSDSSLVPIPSIAPQSYSTPSYTSPTYSAPLNSPAPFNTPAPFNSQTPSSDQAPVAQPRMEASRPLTGSDLYNNGTGFSGPALSSESNDNGSTRFNEPNTSVPAPSSADPTNTAPSDSAPTGPIWKRESVYKNEALFQPRSLEDTTALAAPRTNTPAPIPAPSDYRPSETGSWAWSGRPSAPETSNVVAQPSFASPSNVTPPSNIVSQPSTSSSLPSTAPLNNGSRLTLEAPPLPERTLGTDDLPRLPAGTFTPPSFLPPSMQPTGKSTSTSRTPAREAALSADRHTVRSIPAPENSPAPLPKPPTESGWRPIR